MGNPLRRNRLQGRETRRVSIATHGGRLFRSGGDILEHTEETQGSPAFQAFGIALILLVWINYFSRVVLYAAAWAHTSPAAREQRLAESSAPVQGPQTPALTVRTRGESARPAWVAPFVAGGATALAAVAVLRRRLSKEDL